MWILVIVLLCVALIGFGYALGRNSAEKSIVAVPGSPKADYSDKSEPEGDYFKDELRGYDDERIPTT